MNTEQLEVFVHADGVKPKVVTGEAAELLCDVLNRARIGSVGDADIFVFVGECDEALREPDEIGDGSDQHAPADVKKSLHELDLLRHRHVHVHRCRHIGVEVNFMSKDKRHRFSPATTVGVATAWARKKFHIDPATASEYVLQVCRSIEQPRTDQHLGELVVPGSCSLCFDLVKEITPQG